MRNTAIANLTDQALLVNIILAPEQYKRSNLNLKMDEDGRMAAISRLTDQTIMARIGEDKLTDYLVRTNIVAAMDKSNLSLKRLAGKMSDLTTESLTSIARIKMAIMEQRILDRIPNIMLTCQAHEEYASYSDSTFMRGELVSCSLSNLGLNICEQHWRTNFPDRTSVGRR